MATPRKHPSELKVRKREDIPELTPDQQALAAAYLPLARAMARRRAERCPRLRHDWLSAAGMGLTLAAESWDEARSPSGKFANYAIYAIKAQFRQLRVAERPKGYRRRQGNAAPEGAPAVASFDALIGDRSGSASELPDPGSREPAPDARLLDAERKAEVDRLLALLPPREAAVLRALYLEEKPHAEAAAGLGLTLAALRWRRGRALAKLREAA